MLSPLIHALVIVFLLFHVVVVDGDSSASPIEDASSEPVVCDLGPLYDVRAYYINLDSRPDRSQSMVERLTRHGLPYTRIRARTPQDLDGDVAYWAHRMREAPSSDPRIAAVILSHYETVMMARGHVRAHRFMRQLDDDPKVRSVRRLTLILEDDIRLAPDFCASLRERLDNLPPPDRWSVLKLTSIHSSWDGAYWAGYRDPELENLYRLGAGQMSWEMSAYLVSESGLDALVGAFERALIGRSFYTDDVPPEVALRTLEAATDYDGGVWTSYPYLAVQPDEDSDVQDEDHLAWRRDFRQNHGGGAYLDEYE